MRYTENTSAGMFLSGTVTFELDVIVMCDVHQILPYFGIYRDLFSTAINIRNFGCLLCDDAAVAPRRRRGEATEYVDGGGRRARRQPFHRVPAPWADRGAGRAAALRAPSTPETAPAP